MAELCLRRDPIGERSLYWGVTPSGQVCSSARLVEVLAAGVERQLDPLALVAYLTCAYVPGTATLVRGVFSVEPGTEVTFAGTTPVVHRYWSMPAAPAAYPPEQTLREQLRSALEGAVARALPETPDVGASLSGGIDSSLVVALARQQRRVSAYSLSFGKDHRNELEWSTLVARHTGATHSVIEVQARDVERYFDATVGALSEPNGDPLTVPNALLFERARADGMSVVLNGEGGDPCFGGPKNAPMLLSELYGGTTGALMRERAYLRAHQKLWDDLPVALHPRLREQIREGALEAWVTPWFEDGRWPSFLDRLMAINVAWKGAGHILPKVEHLAERAGVRARSPLFDPAVVELAFAIPAHLKRSGPDEKHLLKAAVQDLLPRAVIDRPKSGMMVPVEAWFNGPLLPFARARLLDGLAPWEIIDRAWLERLLDARLAGLRPRRGVKIWLLLTLASWLDTVLRARP